MNALSTATALLGIVAACNSLGKLCIRPILKRLSQISDNATCQEVTIGSATL